MAATETGRLAGISIGPGSAVHQMFFVENHGFGGTASSLLTGFSGEIRTGLPTDLDEFAWIFFF